MHGKYIPGSCNRDFCSFRAVSKKAYEEMDAGNIKMPHQNFNLEACWGTFHQ